MDLVTIAEQPDGFCPPSLSAKIAKVWERKSGTNETGDWSFQNVDVEQGGTKATLKLKNLPQFPTTREGQMVAITAHKSDKHGLIGVKTETREYNGKTYKSIVVTPSAKWAWGTNGASATAQASTGPVLVPDGDHATIYADHILACAELADRVASKLVMGEPAAVQACFATIVIDTKNRNVLLPSPDGKVPEAKQETEQAEDEEPLDDIPF